MSQANAKEVFMECKTAYQTLVDEQQRRKYDRTLDVGSTCQHLSSSPGQQMV